MDNHFGDMDAWEEIREWEELAARPMRRFRQRADPFVIYTEAEFKERYRLSKQCVQDLLGRIEHHLPQSESERG